MNPVQLSPHFTLEELTVSELAARKGIDNTPDRVVVNNLTSTAKNMELVRDFLGSRPLHVNSGYRCIELNRALGSKDTSAHCEGWAVDFICPAFGSPAEVARAISASEIRYDQLICEGTWVHISFEPRLRQMDLTAKFTRFGVTYSAGLPAAH